MRCRTDTTWFWNTGQRKRDFLSLFFVWICVNQVCARPDFIDSMSKQFFGFMSDDNGQSQQQQYQPTPDPFGQMFGSASQQVPQRPPSRDYHQRPVNPPHRQGYYAPPHAVQQQVHLPYSGPPPVYGQQQGFGQRNPNSNETKTDGYPSENVKHQHPYPPHHQAARQYPPVEYHHQHQPQAVAVEYHKNPETVVEYQTQYHQQHPQQVEYHHIPPQTAVVEEHGPTLEIHAGGSHGHHEPPAHVEYHHPPKVEYHHYTTHKPRKFHLSFNEPSPDYRIIDKHLKLPPVKFRFHINPKIVITSNTKDPLDKKHHDDEHDLEPFPPPDVFSDHDAPPSINKHIVDHYPVEHHYPAVEHHYPVEHHAVKHYAAEYPQAKHPYPVEHHVAGHQPGHEYVYDLSHGHSHINPHRSLGHYEPTFKIKTKPIIFTEPPPTRPTTTTRATTTTARTTTTRSTTARTTSRPTRRARISARNPAFSVAFTQGSTIASTTDPSTTSTTTRRSIFGGSSERERENVGISERRDELSTSAGTSQTTVTRSTTTAPTTTTTTLRPMTTSTTTTTTPRTTTTSATTTTMSTSTKSPSTTTATTSKPTSSTTTSTTTPQSTTTSTTTTTTASTTTPRSTTTTTTTQPTTSTTTTERSTTPTTTTTTQPTSRSTRVTPAEETTPRTTTLSVDANEIDMRKSTEAPRRRPEPLQDKPSSVERSESYNFESSESVKVIETTMLIDGKNQTVRFYYITEPVKLPLDVFQRMTGQVDGKPSGVNVIKIRDKRYAHDVSSVSDNEDLDDL